ncbi:hypothetical protein Ahy_B02g059974 [Arachis hypogaea]|uniref:Uncharacterized protein n=1 Tax=Arachis hypogaea TaxID=3818 RepID=A0A445AHQ9_ARAHY|nr:hypothetical protein Ahy_B02g059974 [Arachis hypogaea]
MVPIVIPLKGAMKRSLHQRARRDSNAPNFASPHPIPALSNVPSHYHTLDLDAYMRELHFQLGKRGLQPRRWCRVSGWSQIQMPRCSDAGEVRRVGGADTCLVPTMSQDHRQLDSSLICKVILSLIRSKPSVIIPVLQGAEESYNKVSKLLQALQSCFLRTICELRATPYYDGHLLIRDRIMFYKAIKAALNADDSGWQVP